MDGGRARFVRFNFSLSLSLFLDFSRSIEPRAIWSGESSGSLDPLFSAFSIWFLIGPIALF